MSDNKLQMFENRLRKVYKHFAKLARKQQQSCFRFYDHDMPEFPFVIEYYDGALHAAEYKRRHGMEDEVHDAWLESCRDVIARVTEITPDLVFIKVRQRKEGKEGQYQKFDTTKQERIVSENGLSFIVNLTDYLDTGLFLDHRITRRMVQEEAEGKRVLNLFCYTGSFSVYAAKGGAKSVTSVDLSKTYINWAKRNMQFNKLYRPEVHEFVQADVMEVIDELPRNSFDLIVCDPPTFSNSKRMDTSFDVQRDHVVLLKKLLKACTEEGKIYFSNNYRGFSMDRDAIPAAVVKDITSQTTPFDFQGRLFRSCFMIQK
ncbi:class I SAM-dependent methyltransferase [Rurimicrobium arvi]|uniref:Class I SAM-dependent methyltransferase n=1 Tax=Rurimicrobium arvi TaxID=2049916 RepID=A0ABP8MIN2_9BACT